LLGTAALNGRLTSSKAKYLGETDSERVLRSKDEKNFGKRVKRLEIVEKEALEEKHYYEVCYVTIGLVFV